jgi:hypothetical protein
MNGECTCKELLMLDYVDSVDSIAGVLMWLWWYFCQDYGSWLIACMRIIIKSQCPVRTKKQKSLSLVVSRPFIPVDSVQPKPPTQSGVVYHVGAHVCLLRWRSDCFRRLLKNLFQSAPEPVSVATSRGWRLENSTCYATIGRHWLQKFLAVSSVTSFHTEILHTRTLEFLKVPITDVWEFYHFWIYAQREATWKILKSQLSQVHVCSKASNKLLQETHKGRQGKGGSGTKGLLQL